MKKFYIYILASLIFASCTSESIVADVQEKEEEIPQPVDESATTVRLDPITVSGDPGSRAYLFYDKVFSTVFSFEWNGGESLGVFAYDSQHPQQIEFKLVDEQSDSSNSLSRMIKPAKDGVNPLTKNTYYVAYFPYNSGFSNYTNIPIDYRNQVQAGHVDMSVYFDATPTNKDKYNTYLTSEKSASSHLSNYDYLCTSPQTTNYKSGINFSLKRVGAISRFYCKVKSGLVYDSLQFYNPKMDFDVVGTIDASKSAGEALTATKTAHTMSLKFGTWNGLDVSGFDMTLKADSEPEDGTYFDYYNNTYTPYLVAYLMMAPADFSSSTVGASTLYLFAHEKGDKDKKHYFKAELASKPNITNNSLYRWSPKPDVDDPIEFEEITVEQWREGTQLTNGDGGNGTSGW